jgi:hypothetical protein
MEQMRGVLQFRAIPDAPVTVRGCTVTPVSKVLSVRLPFGGFVWNRPQAVLVERDGRVERIPILDVTRLVQLGLLALVLVVRLASTYMAARSSRRKET